MAKGYESTKTRITMTTGMHGCNRDYNTIFNCCSDFCWTPPSRYVYDVGVTNNTSNVVTRVIEGIITVRPNVTI